MVLKGQYDGEVGGFEGALSDGLYDILEGNLGADGEAVRDHWLVAVGLVSRPAVELDASAARQQDLSVDLHRRLAPHLVPCNRRYEVRLQRQQSSLQAICKVNIFIHFFLILLIIITFLLSLNFAHGIKI